MDKMKCAEVLKFHSFGICEVFAKSFDCLKEFGVIVKVFYEETFEQSPDQGKSVGYFS